MKFNKKLAVAVSGAVLLMAGQIALADSTTDIVDALVSKGVLTEEEGKLISKGAASKAKADEKANKSRISVGSFIDNATMYGDIRARYERRSGTGVTGTANKDTDELESNRTRYKVSLGVNTKSGKWYSDLAFAMSANGTSDNTTFGNTPASGVGMSNKTSSILYVKRAVVGYSPTEWLSVEAGRVANPLYSVNAMVFDRDIVFEGLNEKLKYSFGSTELFGNLGQYINNGYYQSTNGDTTKNASALFVFQGGATNQLIDKKASIKGALSYYYYGGDSTNNAGVFTPFLAGSTNTVRTGKTTTGNSISQNDLAILDIPLEANYMISDALGVKLYGEYAENLSGSDRYNSACTFATAANVCGLGDDHNAWLVGIVLATSSDLKSLEGNKLKEGQWSANLWYQSVGAYALDPNAVDSDIFDGRTNIEGWALKGQYNVQDNVALNFTGAWGKRKNNALGVTGASGDIDANLKDLDLYQFDATYKF